MRGDRFARARCLGYLVVAVNDSFSVGQLLDPTFTLSVIVPAAFFAVLKRPVIVLELYLVTGGLECAIATFHVAFLMEKLPLPSTLIVPTFLDEFGICPRVSGSAHPAAVAG